MHKKAKKTKKVILLLFSRSNVQAKQFQKVFKNTKHVIVQVDLQENEDPTVEMLRPNWETSDLKPGGSFHIQADWEKQYERFKNKCQVDILISNSPCTYNTYLAKENHYQPGTDQRERRAKMLYWCKVVYKLLTDKEKIPVRMSENPQGNMDKVVTRKNNKDAFDATHPWNHARTNNPDDNHDKLTHWFSGGDRVAIQKHSLQNLVTQTDKADNVVTGWVGKMPDMNARSKIAPGMAYSVAILCKKRLEESCANFPDGNFPLLPLEFHPEMMNKEPQHMCGTPLGTDGDGNVRFCNLRYGHDSGGYFHIQHASKCCGVWDYRNEVWIFKGKSLIQTTKRNRKPVVRYGECEECE